VYSGNSTYSEVIQITVAEAAVGTSSAFVDILSPGLNLEDKERRVITGLEGSGEGVLYLSLRTLEGKGNSYKELKGGSLSYEYREGDIARIIQYNATGDAIYRPYHEFKINGYHYFNDDDKNPIKVSPTSVDDTGVAQKDENAYRRTGWFLSLRDEDIKGFSRAEILAGNDFFSQACLIEILRPKKINEKNLIYQEMGQTYPIVEVGGLRTHGGDRVNSGVNSFTATILGVNKIKTLERLYVGDRLAGATIVGGGDAFVSSVSPVNEGGFEYWIVSGSGGVAFASQMVSTQITMYVPSTPGLSGNSFDGIVTLTTGDVIFRLREQMVNFRPETPVSIANLALKYDVTKPDEQSYDKFFIESLSVSDFFDSRALALGRGHAETPTQQRQTRSVSLTYSKFSSLDSSVLALSEFIPSLYPFKDFSSQHGSITYLLDRDENLLVLQEKKVLMQPIGRTLIESAEGGQLVTSTEVLGTETYMAGSYGPSKNPESVVERFGKIFFTDVEAGKVVSITPKGISLPSDTGMEAHFETKFAGLLEQGSVINTPCGIDPENNEFIVTSPGFGVNDISVGGSVIVSAGVTADASYEGSLLPEITTNTIGWDTEISRWDMSADIEPWEEIGQGVVYLDKINDYGFTAIDPEFTASSTVTVAILNTSNTFRGVATIDVSASALDIGTGPYNDTADSSQTLVVTSAAGESSAVSDTIAYSTTYDKWMSMYSFTPELYAHIHNKFFSYKDGQMYRHNINATRNNFYGVQEVSKIKLISNQNPSSIKVYNAMSIEGDSKWSGVVANSSQTTNIPVEMLEEKEGLFYSVIPKDITGSSTKNMSHKVVLGVVASVDTDTITFSSRVNNLPFGLGDAIWGLEAATESDTTYTIIAIPSRTSIQVSASASGVSVGDTLMAVSSAVVNGDKIRDYYASIELSTSTADTGPVELYAVNMVYSPSSLHNEIPGGVAGKQKKA